MKPKIKSIISETIFSFDQATEFWITETVKDLRWHHGDGDPFTCDICIENGEKFHPSQKEEKELVELESSLYESHKAGRQTGEGESRDIKRKKLKELRNSKSHWS